MLLWLIIGYPFIVGFPSTRRPPIRFLFVVASLCPRLPSDSRSLSTPWPRLAVPISTVRRGLPPLRSSSCPAHKNPALTGGVSLQFKLRLTRLLLALVPYIPANRGLVDAHRGGEQSSCPHSTAILIHSAQPVREFLFQLPTRHAYQRFHYP